MRSDDLALMGLLTIALAMLRPAPRPRPALLLPARVPVLLLAAPPAQHAPSCPDGPACIVYGPRASDGALYCEAHNRVHYTTTTDED
jgi:hypothetical protein